MENLDNNTNAIEPVVPREPEAKLSRKSRKAQSPARLAKSQKEQLIAEQKRLQEERDIESPVERFSRESQGEFEALKSTVEANTKAIARDRADQITAIITSTNAQMVANIADNLGEVQGNPEAFREVADYLCERAFNAAPSTGG